MKKKDDNKDDGKGRQAKVDALGFGEDGFSQVDHDDGYQTCLVFLRAVKPEEKPAYPETMLIGAVLGRESLVEPVLHQQGCKRKAPRTVSPENGSSEETSRIRPSQEESTVEKEAEEENLQDHASLEDNDEANSGYSSMDDSEEEEDETEEQPEELAVVNTVAYKVEETAEGEVIYPRLLNSNGKRSLWDDDSSEYSEYEYDDEEEEEWQQRQKVIEMMNNARNRFAPTWSRDGMDVAVS